MKWATTTTALAVVVGPGFLFAQAPGTPAESARRARAWATILAIQDESIRTLDGEVEVMVHRADAPDVRLLTYQFRCDEFRNVRMSGEMCGVAPSGEVLCRPVTLSNIDGITRAFNTDKKTGIVRAERPDLIYLWCSASPVVGLGRFVNLNQLRSRSDHLMDCSDLRVDGETSASVTIVGMGRLDGRFFEHRVEIDPRTGDVRRHQVVEPAWGSLFVEWTMPEWEQIGAVRLPVRIEYRIYEPALDQETRASLRQLRTAAGLDAKAMVPDSPNFARWVQMRDGYLQGCPVPVRLTTDWQSCRARFAAVNIEFEPSSLQVTRAEPPQVILSDLLECQVDSMQPEPSQPASGRAP